MSLSSRGCEERWRTFQTRTNLCSAHCTCHFHRQDFIKSSMADQIRTMLYPCYAPFQHQVMLFGCLFKATLRLLYAPRHHDHIEEVWCSMTTLSKQCCVLPVHLFTSFIVNKSCWARDKRLRRTLHLFHLPCQYHRRESNGAQWQALTRMLCFCQSVPQNHRSSKLCIVSSLLKTKRSVVLHHDQGCND